MNSIHGTRYSDHGKYPFVNRDTLRCVTILYAISMLWAYAVHAQSTVLYSIDARSASMNLLDLDTGQQIARFTPPILCKPEGACGLAYTGRSLFMVDSTDPDRVIYEMSPVDGTIWNSFPVPAQQIDGLAYADGTLYALDFAADRIFALDPYDGSIRSTLEPGEDLVGGLAAGGGMLYASRIRPASIFSVDAQSGELVDTWDAPVLLPTGLSMVGDKLYVGDFSGGRVKVMNPTNGTVTSELVPRLGDIAAVAAGRVMAGLPHYLSIARPVEQLREDGQVDITIRVGMYDDQDRPLYTNNHTQMQIALSGTVMDTTVYTVEDGMVELSFLLEPGANLLMRAQVDGLEPVETALRVVSPVTRAEIDLVEDAANPGLIEIKAYLYDAADALAVGDTNTVRFAVLGGRALLVGAPTAQPHDGVASSWLYTDGLETDITVETQVRDIVGVVTVNTGIMARLPENTELSKSRRPVAGRDNVPPSAVDVLRAVHLGQGRVEVTWNLVPEDGQRYFVPFGNQTIARNGIEGYRLLRSDNGAMFTEIATLPAGNDRFIDQVDPDGGPYKYQLVVSDTDNWRFRTLSPGSSDDVARTAYMVVVGVNAEGEEVRGLFDDDGDVDLDDFFLFAEVFGNKATDEEFNGTFDLDADGRVGLSDFFIFADSFGQQAVVR